MRRTRASLLIGLVSLLLGMSGLAQAAGGTAQFAYSPAHPDINTPVTLDASASSLSAGVITTYVWDFNGDGQSDLSSARARVTHLFDQSGDRAVSLSVSDAAGNSASITRVIRVASAPVRVRRTISTPIAPNRVAAGSSFQVTVTIKTTEAISGLGLDEDPPQGWRVSLVNGAGAAYKFDATQFLWLATLNPGETRQVVYNITVPANASPGLYTLAGRVSSFSPRFKIEVVGDTQVQVF